MLFGTLRPVRASRLAPVRTEGTLLNPVPQERFYVAGSDRPAQHG